MERFAAAGAPGSKLGLGPPLSLVVIFQLCALFGALMDRTPRASEHVCVRRPFSMTGWSGLCDSP